MLDKLHTLLCLSAIVTPGCEVYTSGTVTGLSLIPLGTAILLGLALMCRNPKQEKQEITITHAPRVELICKGKGWKEEKSCQQ